MLAIRFWAARLSGPQQSGSSFVSRIAKSLRPIPTDSYPRLLRKKSMPRFALLVASLFLTCLALRLAAAGEMPFVRVSDDRRGFVLDGTGERFVPWGFNYDHDEKDRLIEDYWETEWDKVVEDF